MGYREEDKDIITTGLTIPTTLKTYQQSHHAAIFFEKNLLKTSPNLHLEIAALFTMVRKGTEIEFDRVDTVAGAV